MKVLFLAGHEFLKEQHDGGRKMSLRNYNLLKNLVGKDNLYVCTFSNEESNGQDDHIKIFKGHTNRLEQYWDALNNRIVCNKKTEKEVIEFCVFLNLDIICYERSIMGNLGMKIQRKYNTLNRELKHFVFMENIEKKYAWYKVIKENILYIVPYLAFSNNEKECMEYADKVFCLNKRDERLLEELYGRKSDFLLPMTFEDKYNSNFIIHNEVMKSSKNKLLFIGSLFGPNYKGLEWFLKNVFPNLTNVELYLVGKNLEKKKNELEQECVHVIGSTANLEPYYYEADAMVMPIFYGGGIKVKTAEAMMYGKTIFATDEALEGYDVNGVHGIYRCNTADQFITSIEAYLNGGEVIKSNRAIRNLFCEKYETGSLVKNFSEVFLTRG